jgi:phosphoglycerol transferase MdoB-like AlkP superfamily enzyme
MESLLNALKKATNLQPLLDFSRSGRMIRRTLSLAFRGFALLIGLVLLLGWIREWALIKDLKFLSGVVFLIWQVVFLYAAFLALKVLYMRAASIEEAPESDYVVGPIMATLTKTAGEMVFIYLAVMSVPAMLLTWAGLDATTQVMTCRLVRNTFMAGLGVLVMNWVVGFLALLLTQLAAEWTLAVFSIAGDVNLIRRHTAPSAQPPVASESPAPVPPAGP